MYKYLHNSERGRIFASEIIKITTLQRGQRLKFCKEIMTQREFTQRTQVEVSSKEFDAINEVYMNSDLDKDEFCKMWVKMNKTRVENAKVEHMMKQKDEAYRDALYKFYTRTNDSNEFQTPICYVKISTYEVQAMSYAGIKVTTEGGHAKFLLDIRYEIGKFLRMY